MAELYPVAEALFDLAIRVMGFRVEAHGLDNIPREGGAVLASNHVGYVDFAFVVLAPPRPRRRVRFVARREVFAHPIAGPLMRRLHMIEADPYGDAGRVVVDAVEHLRRGDLVGIHPEGTISPSFVPRAGKTGAARMAAEAGVPLVPTAVWGAHRMLTKWREPQLRRGLAVTVVYGTPFEADPGDPLGTTLELMARITELFEEAQKLHPQHPSGPDDRWWLPAHAGGTAPTPEEAEARIAAQQAERRARRQAEERDERP